MNITCLNYNSRDTFGVGIIDEQGNVLANELNSFMSSSRGMIPDEIAKHHQEVAEEVLQNALQKANISWNDIGNIAYSAGPGLDPALWAGYHIAKKWAHENGKKLIGVNHPAAHLSIGKVYNHLNDPVYLYVSGVNTQIIVQEKGNGYGVGKYKVIGETLDIGLGNMLDKFGRIIGLGFPAGPEIEKLALQGSYVELPYVVKGMDTSFSGILTKVKQLYEKSIINKKNNYENNNINNDDDNNNGNSDNKKNVIKNKEKDISKEDLCYSVQETTFAMLTEVVERAMAHTGKNELLLVGGVGANKRFCEMLTIMCQERGATFYKVPMNLARDNGAMIAWEGFLRKDSSGDIEVNPHWRIDEV